ncbi:hypothetical protein G7Y79_00061g092990 [Physcia stellaris]|nr:hypothetical protein G7Y79_00061g092990 [Physcia stellaris]
MGGGKYVLRDGEAVDTSFSHLLFYGLPRSRTLRRKTELKYVADTAPAPAAPPAAPPAPAPAPVPEATPAPEAAPAAEPVPDLPPAPEVTPEPAADFSAADDEAILKLKGENKTWAEIGEVVKGKDKNELRKRYKELMAKNGGSAAPAPASPSSEARKKMEEGVGTALQTERPIVYIDEEDGLNIEDLQLAYDLFVRYEGRKWALIASKLFDQTGKRIDPEVLKAKFTDVGGA